jgi:hypothetical protein
MIFNIMPYTKPSTCLSKCCRGDGGGCGWWLQRDEHDSDVVAAQP